MITLTKKKQQGATSRIWDIFPFGKPTRFPHHNSNKINFHHSNDPRGSSRHVAGFLPSSRLTSSIIVPNSRSPTGPINSVATAKSLNGNKRSQVSTTRKAQIFLGTYLHPQGNLHIDGLRNFSQAAKFTRICSPPGFCELEFLIPTQRWAAYHTENHLNSSNKMVQQNKTC